MNYKVGDRVVYIVNGKYYGMQGDIIQIDYNKGRYQVLYNCNLCIKIFASDYDDWEYEIQVRGLTKLEKALQ